LYAHVAEAIWAVYKCQSVLKTEISRHTSCGSWRYQLLAIPFSKSFSRCCWWSIGSLKQVAAAKVQVELNSLEDFLSICRRKLFFACLSCPPY
jgi:hypothetical protein